MGIANFIRGALFIVSGISTILFLVLLFVKLIYTAPADFGTIELLAACYIGSVAMSMLRDTVPKKVENGDDSQK